MDARPGAAPAPNPQPQREQRTDPPEDQRPGLRDQGMVRSVLGAARAQYCIRRSDYLHGVIAALCWVLGDTRRPPVTGIPVDVPPPVERVRHEEAQARAAAQEAIEESDHALDRRDFCLGSAIALAWVVRLTDALPVRVRFGTA